MRMATTGSICADSSNHGCELLARLDHRRAVLPSLWPIRRDGGLLPDCQARDEFGPIPCQFGASRYADRPFADWKAPCCPHA